MVIKAILLDLDGTVYNGNKLIDGVDKAIENMRMQNIQVAFCTNNSSKLPSSIALKLNKMGIDCCEPDILSSGMMAIKYVEKEKLDKVYILGTEEIKSGFISVGINVCDENEAEVLVIGMDTEYNYEKMTKGLRAAIRSKKIILCNKDRYFEKEDGIYPGNGGMTSSILYCSNKEPDIIIGKPNTLMLEYFCRCQKYSKEEILVIGDSDESDMAMADNFGCKSILISKTDKKDRVTIRSLKETVYWDWSGEIWK